MLLVDSHDGVDVESVDHNGIRTLTLHVPESVADKVIGRHGQTAQSIRVIVKALGVKLNRRYWVEIEPIKTS